MGTRTSVVDGRDQSLLNNNSNNDREQPHEGDVHLSIGQPTMKNTLAIKNPFLLKKESLVIERDSIDRSFYYISFKYDSLIDFKVNIILLSKGVKNNKDTLYKSILDMGNESQPSGLSFTCSKGFDIKFDDPSCKIDCSLFDNREEFQDVENDLVIEFIPIDFPTTDPLGFYTICSLIDEKITENNRIYKLKVDSQRLRAQSMVLEINELFLAHRDQGECLICYEKLANTVLLPCRHSCCSGCAHGLRLRNLPCPMCKNSKT
jgi:hypothetical protein